MFAFFRLVLLSCSFFIVSVHIANAASPQADNPVVALNNQLKTMQTLRAKFNQRIEDDQGVLLQQANGEMSVKRPRQLLWKTITPYEHLMVTDGKVLWLYDIDLEQITQRPFTKDLDKAPALLLSGEINDIADQYTITQQARENGSIQFRLIPVDSNQLFQSMLITFKGDVIQSMVLRDNFNQQTSIDFSEVKLNLELPSDIFQFTPPEGVDVMSAQ